MPCPAVCKAVVERVAARLVAPCARTFQWSELAAASMRNFKGAVAAAQLTTFKSTVAESPVTVAGVGTGNAYFTALAHAVGNVSALAVSLHLVNSRVLQLCGWPAAEPLRLTQPEDSEGTDPAGVAVRGPESRSQASVQGRIASALLQVCCHHIFRRNRTSLHIIPVRTCVESCAPSLSVLLVLYDVTIGCAIRLPT